MQISTIREENKVLHAQQSRMKNELSGFESGDYDVPHTMKKHTDELRAVKEELRLQTVKIRKTERKLLKKVLMRLIIKIQVSD
jgi:Ciliary protein causing Leber congenital amaurosis disease